MHDLKKEFGELEAFLLDMDGVLYIEDSLIEGSKEAVNGLKKQGKEILFLTNNSTRTRANYERKLSDMELNGEEVMTSAYATALYLSEQVEEGKCYVIGEDGLKKELKNAGLEVLSQNESEKADFVIVGMDRDMTYNKIAAGLSAILSGADFIATNPDPTYPTEEGLAPGAGACIGALSACVERDPSTVIGKPSSYMIEASLDILNASPEKTAIVGDRIHLDIQAGKELGLTTIFVLSGADSKEDFEAVKGTKEAPDYVLPNLGGLFN